jgi:hypothetical protein
MMMFRAFILLTASLYSLAAWGELSEYIEYECLPPVTIVDFDSHLADGTLEHAIPWSTIAGLQIDPMSRLVFRQRVAFEYIEGTLIAIEDGQLVEMVDAGALTGTPYTLKLLRHAPRRKPLPGTDFVRALISISERNGHVFLLQSHDFKVIDSLVFGSVLGPGTLVFTSEAGAVLLAAGRRQMAFCAERGRYKGRSSGPGWSPVEPPNPGIQNLSRSILQFVRSADIHVLLKCEELLGPLLRH